MKTIKFNGHRHRVVGSHNYKHHQHGLGRCPLKIQALLIIWTLLATIVAVCLVWTHHKMWLVVTVSAMGSFIWHARLTVGELLLELWVFILRVLERKD
jgi:hypothetical protein